MNPINVPGTNYVYSAPKGMEDEVQDLHVYRHEGRIASFWLPDAQELMGLIEGRPVVLSVFGGQHPVVAVSVSANNQWGANLGTPQDLQGHELANLVNDLRDTAISYHAHGSLRERISRIVMAALGRKAR